MSVLATLDGFFAARAPLCRGDRLVVGFSGGPDSTALLTGLARWSRRHDLAILAAHLDHALDRGSAQRSRAAARIAARLGVAFVQSRCPVATLRQRGESLEAAARRLRYGYLERVRLDSGARYVATAHHLDDQAETVVLRLRQGTGPAGLAAIARRRGTVVRPLLDLTRAELASWLARHGPRPITDPTNRDLGRARNLVRHRLLPALDPGAPDLAGALARLAATAHRAHHTVEHRLLAALAPTVVESGVAVERRRFEALPAPLHRPALELLHRFAGATVPASAGARRELARQLAGGAAVGCDCGAGWALVSRDDRLVLRRERLAPPPFAYTLGVPGRVDLPAGMGKFRLSRQTVRPWMFRSSSRRAGLSLATNAGERITVRSRWPGDRIRPFGCSYDRRLKDVLIDRKVPRHVRNRLPLLCVGRRVVWVPGVTLDERCRLTAGERAWVAEWQE